MSLLPALPVLVPLTTAALCFAAWKYVRVQRAIATAGVANIGLPLPANLNDESKNTMYVDWVHTYRLVAD